MGSILVDLTTLSLVREQLLRLRKFQMADMPVLLAAIPDAKMLMQFAGPSYVYPLTAEQVQLDLQADGVGVFSVVTEEGEVVGHAQIRFFPEHFLLRRIVIWDAAWRGQSWGKRVVQQLLDTGFAMSSAHVAQLNVFDWNQAAIHCYQALGFVVQAGMEKTVCIEGETWHSIRMCCNKPVADVFLP